MQQWKKLFQDPLSSSEIENIGKNNLEIEINKRDRDSKKGINLRVV